MKIKRNSIVEAVNEIKGQYSFSEPIKAGTKGRVWRVKRDGTFYVSFEGRYGSDTAIVVEAQIKAIESPKNVVKVGDLFCSSWGYEQTNCDFYQVTRVTAKSIGVRHINSNEITTGMMQGEATPIKDSFRGDEEMHVVNYDGSGKPSFRVNSFSHAYPTTETESHYCSWGH